MIKFDVTEQLVITLADKIQPEAQYERIQDCSLDSLAWEIDDRLIDFDMLTSDAADADRMYLELKERAIRQKKKELKDKEIEDAIEIEEAELDQSEG